MTAYLDRIKRQAYRQVVEKVWDQILWPVEKETWHSEETWHSVRVWTEMGKAVVYEKREAS